MPAFPTSKERIAINLAFEWLGESPFNRTPREYRAIWNRLPKLAALHAYINQRLQEIAEQKAAPYLICRFQPGDRAIRYEDFPTSLSRETIRTALTKFFGMPIGRRCRS
jgi:hypothetical protein